jgi:hypothetical protein
MLSLLIPESLPFREEKKMSLKFGDVDIGQIIENEFKIAVLERMVEWILDANIGQMKLPPKQVIQEIQQNVLKVLEQKYPNSGLSMIGGENEPRKRSGELSK